MIFSQIQRLQPWHKVLIGLFLGALTGFILGDSAAHLKPLGDLFIRLIKMIVVPLVFFSILNGMNNVSNARELGRIGIKAGVAYVGCTSFAILLGFLGAWIFEPGRSLIITTSQTTMPPAPFSLLQTLLNIVPDNAIGAMADGAILQVVFFSVFTGSAMILMGPKADPIRKLTKDMMQVVFTMVQIIVKLAPLAAFALTAWCVGTQGMQVILSLSKLMLAGLFAMSMQYLVFGAMILIFGKLSPKPFYKKSIEYQAIAFSTSSTKASLSTTMTVCRERLGISNVSSSFILPLGATINMDGLAIYLGLCAITFAQAHGVQLTLADYGTIIFTATLGSIGGAGIPSAALVMLPMVLSSVHLPMEGVALIAGIDRIMDMFRSSISITGDAAVTLVVDRSEGLLDEKTYYS